MTCMFVYVFILLVMLLLCLPMFFEYYNVYLRKFTKIVLVLSLILSCSPSVEYSNKDTQAASESNVLDVTTVAADNIKKTTEVKTDFGFHW